MSDNIQLREYIEAILDEREKALRLTAEGLEHRLNALNELRAEVTKDRDLYLTKAVYAEMHQSLLDRVEKLESTQSRIIGAAVTLIALSGLIGLFASHIFKI